MGNEIALWVAAGVAVILLCAGVTLWQQLRLRRLFLQLNRLLDDAIDGSLTQQVIDETEISSLEAKLYRHLCIQQRAGERLAQERGQVDALIADISHQTKTPIANILLYAQLLQEQALPSGAQTQAVALGTQAEKLSFLIGSLLKASRLESGIITVQPQPSAVVPLLEAVCTQAQPLADAAGVTLFCQSCGTLTACFDPKWTAEAFFNLVDNAIKYTPAGGSVTLCAQCYEVFLRVDIADTGIGIAEQEQAQVFTRFYRSPQVAAQAGVGLGLWLAREIVLRQGGYIKLRSSVGMGSTFSVFLPLSPKRTNLAKL